MRDLLDSLFDRLEDWLDRWLGLFKTPRATIAPWEVDERGAEPSSGRLIRSVAVHTTPRDPVFERFLDETFDARVCLGQPDRLAPGDCEGWCYAPSVACDKCNRQLAIEDANEVYFEVRDNTVLAEFTCSNGCHWHPCAVVGGCDGLADAWDDCDELNQHFGPTDCDEHWNPNPCSREG